MQEFPGGAPVEAAVVVREDCQIRHVLHAHAQPTQAQHQIGILVDRQVQAKAADLGKRGPVEAHVGSRCGRNANLTTQALASGEEPVVPGVGRRAVLGTKKRAAEIGAGERLEVAGGERDV